MQFNPYQWADRCMVDLPEYGIDLTTVQQGTFRLVLAEVLQAVWIDATARQGTQISDLDTLQRMIVMWAAVHFPNSTMSSKLAHLREELDELEHEPTLEEAADMLIILLHIADELGGSLMAAAVAKFQINLNRKWLPPDAHGMVKHDPQADQLVQMQNAAAHFMHCVDCAESVDSCPEGRRYRMLVTGEDT